MSSDASEESAASDFKET